ncbi:hypothetical protein [Polyangium sp. y55x31]|uniref:hypothetical protein n=1 Tax=Polyangium sp. y55x31 TaxID=3042688 RepID=UPI002482D87A|nr:hypothetical protein [Polyangium sp. y55x31]MDI1480414.1 hypothetical protein [Polyangium sp. y55x31]
MTRTTVAVGLMLALAPLDAGAAPPHYRVELSAANAPPACNDPEGLREELEMALSRSLRLLEPPASRVVEFRVERAPGRPYVVDILFKDLDGHVLEALQRKYPGSMECFKVLHGAAIVAAIQMENRENLPDERPAPPPPPPPPPPAAPPPACPTAPTDRPRPEPPNSAPTRIFAGLGPSFSYGTLPAASLGPQLVLGVQRDRYVLELDARWSPLWEARPLGPTAVEVHAISATVAGCYRRAPFMGCVFLAGGALSAAALNRAYPEVNTTWFLGAGLRGTFERTITGPLSLRADFDVMMTLVPAGLDAREPVLWSTSPVALNMATSMVLAF